MIELPRVVSTAAAHDCGYSDARIRTELGRDRWRRLAAGVFLTRPDVATRDDWIHVGLALSGPSGVVSGWDAVRFKGLGPVSPPSPEVLVLVGTGAHRLVGRVRLRPSRRSIRWTSVSVLDERFPCVRMASPARAVADTALMTPDLGTVRAMVTGAVQRSLATPQELAIELASSPRNGSGHLRTALADLMSNARSVAEAEAIDLLRAAGISGFEVNAPIYDGAGRAIYRADFLWPSLRAILEIDSREFHFGEREWKATMRRHNDLTALGYAVAHYPPSEIRARGPAWAVEVHRWLDHRAAELGRPAA